MAEGSPMEILLNEFVPGEAEARAVEKAVAAGAAPTVRKGLNQKPIPLGFLSDPQPEEKNPSALFRRGWLRKGGGAFLVAPSGVGKSVLTVQAAICWALGRSAFGIVPVRPLKICIIQSEDDKEEMSYFRNCIQSGLTSAFGFTLDEIRSVIGTKESDDAHVPKVILHDAIGKTGEALVDELKALHAEYPDIDLFIINPFQSYYGGDINKNAEVTAFLRGSMDPLIKGANGEGLFAVLFVHHTNKPPNTKDERRGWGMDTFSAYIGAGGAELVNWARAVLSLMPTKEPGVFTLKAGKRGQRLGWKDAEENPTDTRWLAHANDGGVYWRDATPDEIALATLGSGKSEKGGRPRVYSAMDAAHAVNAKPRLSENGYRGILSNVLGCSSSQAKLLLTEAVSKGWLTTALDRGCRRYDLTETGRSVVGQNPTGRQWDVSLPIIVPKTD